MNRPNAPALIDRYLDVIRAQLDHLRTTQRPAIDHAAAIVATSLDNDGVVHLFGTGHSHMLAEEVFYRAGGLVPVDAMLDPSVVLSGGAWRSTETERRSGAAAEIAGRYDLRPGDAGIVISNSGRNPAPVEMAQLMRTRGLGVIGVTCVTHSLAAPPLVPPGVRLLDVCDVVLDTGGVYGDATLCVEGVPYAVGPTSTVVGAALLQCLFLATIERLMAAGAPVVNLPSANVAGADLGAVAAEIAKYRGRIRHL